MFVMTSLNKAAQLLGSKGGKASGQAKSRSHQLRSWWQGAAPHERKARIDRMTKGREDARSKHVHIVVDKRLPI